MGAPRVVVVGGSGFYGRYVVADLLRQPEVTVTVVSRRPPAPGFGSPRVDWVAADRTDGPRLAELFADAAAVVHCAGPFPAIGAQPWEPLRAALAARVPYVDISEDRAFRHGALELAAGAEVSVVTGASVVPGLQALLVRDLAQGLDRVDAVRCSAAPDTRRHRGPAMFEAMLHGAGLRFEAPRGGKAATVYGWSEPEWVQFPPPVGRRLVHQVYEMADLDVLPELFGARTVSFKAGTEFGTLNRALGAFAAFRARTGRPRQPERWTPVVRGVSWLVGRFGDEAGAFMVEVTGPRGGRTLTRRIGLTVLEHGGRIPALLAGIAVERLLGGALDTPGVLPLDRWLPAADLYAAFKDRDVRLWTTTSDDTDDWRIRLFPSAKVEGRDVGRLI
ncbi:saccharopine dehydrogenase family protein [Streptodolium elevatio]|uniref:NAD-dependent epimerase/dehydratase family protein n=1 Tax=Streptodolium elevatio TaxID=3157996 RepID=A0ABV3DLJ5_9ACTN